MYDEITKYINNQMLEIEANTMTSLGEELSNKGTLDAFDDVRTFIETLEQETK